LNFKTLFIFLKFVLKSALIIFVRNPVLGKVKTRIAKDLGDDVALDIYKKLLVYTHSITKALPVHRTVFYADYLNDHDLWEASSYNKMLQWGSDLGERMHHAFEFLFAQGYSKVAIIGSDCMDLDQAIMTQAFDALENNDAVIGPSLDGGYYLLGMNVFMPEVFKNKHWSTETVFDETIDCIKKAGYSFFLLPKLSDVDNGEDCKKYSQLLSLAL